MRYVYCHPLFDERKCAHRFSFRLSSAFSAAGLTLERFDYRGTGEASGEFADVLLQSLRDDVSRCVDGETICLIGTRFGASLALDYCAHGRGSVSRLVLIEPIVDGAAYIDYLYRKQRIKDLMTGGSSDELRDEGYQNVEGYKTSVRLIGQIRDLDLLDVAGKHPVTSSVFIAQVSRRSAVRREIVNLARALKSSAREVLVENVEAPMFWERIPIADYTELVEKVLGWCCG